MADDERRAEIEAMARAMYDGAHRRWAIDPKTTRWPGAHKSVSFDALDRGIRGAYLDEAEDSLKALNAVRDARGDDEAGRCICTVTGVGSAGGRVLRPDDSCPVHGRSAETRDRFRCCDECGHLWSRHRGSVCLDCEAARSPQSEAARPRISGEDAAALDRLADHPHPGKIGSRFPQGEDHETAFQFKLPSPSVEEHEAGIEAFCEVLFRWQPSLRDVLDDTALDEAIAAYLSRVSPSRDGSVAVEDVLAALATNATEDVILAAIRNGRKPNVAVAQHIEREFSPASTGDQAPDGQ